MSKSSSKSLKKVLLYNPYLDVMGGGERHILSILFILAQHGYQADIAWDDAAILGKLQKNLNIDTSHFSLKPHVFKKGMGKERDHLLKQYDIFLYVTDGSYFVSPAKRNVIFAMYPEKSLYKLFPLNWIKLHNYDLVANGTFTAEYVSKWINKKATVIHPYVDKEFFTRSQVKKRQILSVGRMFKHLHSKRQDVLIDAFNALQNRHETFKDFEFVIAGGLKDEDKEYYDELVAKAQGNNSIKIMPNVSFTRLLSLYAESSLYWHAAGYGVDVDKHPDRVEHLGITPLEAMASRCLTFCHSSGGPAKHIVNGNNGYLYSSIDDLVNKTANGFAVLEKSTAVVDAGRQYVSTHFSYPVFKNTVVQYFAL